MSTSPGTDVAMAAAQANEFPDDVIFGFDIKDEDAGRYLGELVMNGVGEENDIQHLVNLSLMRGVEEWNQAISCAQSMKERATFDNPLDGQDTLTFLAKIYGVDGTPHSTNDIRPPAREVGHSCVKKGPRNASPSLDLEVRYSSGPPRKRRKFKKGKDSPYWAATPPPELCKNGQTGDEVTARRKGNRASPGNESPLGQSPAQGSGKRGFDLSNVVDCRVKSMETTPPLSDNQVYESETTYNTTQRASAAVASISRESGSSSDSIHEAGHITQEPSPPRKTLEAPLTPEKEGLESEDFQGLRLGKPIQTIKRKAKSHYFIESTTPQKGSPSKKPEATPKSRRPPRGTVSSLPFPPLDAPNFGLIQEELAGDPFRLLIAVTFLIRTSGKAALPVFRELMERYPTPEALAAAENTEAIVSAISHLGLGVVRAATIQRYARMWLENPPRKGVVYPVKNYPLPPPLSGTGTGPGRKEEECLNAGGRGIFVSPEELGGEEAEGEGGGGGDSAIPKPVPTSSATTTTTEWEIGHMTQGPYSLDSWRIFCRDVLRGVSQDWKGHTTTNSNKVFQPEWMRVLPRDKELRACLRWMWMQEGWLWDPLTGDTSLLPEALRRAVQDGRVGYDDSGNLRILDEEGNDEVKDEHVQ
ncbi:DNA glycosylase [Xylariaceae sp. FL0594]|nr:DNA glycosylase [Xylariaceae sp. FL0594]